MHERDAILALRGLFPVSPRQKNAVFTCDAELVELGGQLYGLSMDEFSAEEDMFPDGNPEALGANLAVAVLADILAAGCLPEFYLHALAAPRGAPDFCLELARGVRSVLEQCGCFLLGGDMGSTAVAGWRYTGCALGRVADPAAGPLTRILPPKAQALWITGTVGDGNLCALRGVMPVFELRLTEARSLPGKAAACMDTSGGLVESVVLLHSLNSGHRIELDAAAIPYDIAVLRAAQTADLPVAGFAFGGAGEYELLFATDESEEISCATRIGTAYPANGGQTGVFWGGRQLPPSLPDARSFPDTGSYIRHLLTVVRQCTE